MRRSLESANAQARATEDDFQVVLLTLEGDVAQNYVNLRLLDFQDDILRQNVAAFRHELSLIETQFRAGLASQLDVLQAETQLHSTVTQEVDVRRQRADVEHALAILLGRPPSELSIAPEPLRLAPPAIPAAGLPSDLLRRRPDVAEAEETLRAANAQVGVAEAQFYPVIKLTGLAGYESADFQHLLDWKSRIWSIGPSVTFPIFLGGQLTANLEEARARWDEVAATYRSRVLLAFRDVEDALTDLHLRAEQAESQERAVHSSREVLRLSELRFQRGLVNYLQVIDAERTLLANELSAAQILNQRLVSTVLLIKALGGGWDP